MMVSNKNLLFRGVIFRCYVSFREGRDSSHITSLVLSHGILAGSFFDVDDLPAGSYEVGPPYTEEVPGKTRETRRADCGVLPGWKCWFLMACLKSICLSAKIWLNKNLTFLADHFNLSEHVHLLETSTFLQTALRETWRKWALKKARWWFQTNVIFTWKIGARFPIWRSYFSDGLVQPPTMNPLASQPRCVFLGLFSECFPNALKKPSKLQVEQGFRWWKLAYVEPVTTCRRCCENPNLGSMFRKLGTVAIFSPNSTGPGQTQVNGFWNPDHDLQELQLELNPK